MVINIIRIVVRINLETERGKCRINKSLMIFIDDIYWWFIYLLLLTITKLLNIYLHAQKLIYNNFNIKN